jgi:hypothetical protein
MNMLVQPNCRTFVKFDLDHHDLAVPAQYFPGYTRTHVDPFQLFGKVKIVASLFHLYLRY